ncbi:MAG: hypothetical protein V3S25_08905 [Nitrospirales bacterium]
MVSCLLLSQLVGCASLVIKEDDGALVTAGKMTTRIALAVPTFLMSEIVISAMATQQARQPT